VTFAATLRSQAKSSLSHREPAAQQRAYLPRSPTPSSRHERTSPVRSDTLCAGGPTPTADSSDKSLPGPEPQPLRPPRTRQLDKHRVNPSGWAPMVDSHGFRSQPLRAGVDMGGPQGWIVTVVRIALAAGGSEDRVGGTDLR